MRDNAVEVFVSLYNSKKEELKIKLARYLNMKVNLKIHSQRCQHDVHLSPLGNTL